MNISAIRENILYIYKMANINCCGSANVNKCTCPLNPEAINPSKEKHYRLEKAEILPLYENYVNNPIIHNCEDLMP